MNLNLRKNEFVYQNFLQSVAFVINVIEVVVVIFVYLTHNSSIYCQANIKFSGSSEKLRVNHLLFISGCGVWSELPVSALSLRLHDSLHLSFHNGTQRFNWLTGRPKVVQVCNLVCVTWQSCGKWTLPWGTLSATSWNSFKLNGPWGLTP